MSRKKRILFMCAHNSARSPIAEGLLTSLYGDRYQVYSAGIEPREVHPLAVKVMAEKEIDISDHKPTSIKDLWGQEFEVLAKIRDFEIEPCTFFPAGKKRIHKELKDPLSAKGTEEEQLEAFRKARDELESWIVGMFG